MNLKLHLNYAFNLTLDLDLNSAFNLKLNLQLETELNAVYLISFMFVQPMGIIVKKSGVNSLHIFNLNRTELETDPNSINRILNSTFDLGEFELGDQFKLNLNYTFNSICELNFDCVQFNL